MKNLKFAAPRWLEKHEGKIARKTGGNPLTDVLMGAGCRQLGQNAKTGAILYRTRMGYLFNAFYGAQGWRLDTNMADHIDQDYYPGQGR